MGTGKSTAIQILERYLSKGKLIALVKFAQPLYNLQEAFYNEISPVYTRPSNFIKDRLFLQTVGTLLGRDHISQTLWVDLWQAKIKALEEDGYDFVVTDDCRFNNEAETVRAMGGVVIKLTSTRNLERITTATNTTHASELGIDNSLVNAKVINDGTIAEFRDKLVILFDELGLRK